MPPKADDGKQQQCWACLRRHLACDGCHPVCECCRSAGIVCPGYEDRRPLTWVTPGHVTITRMRRARTAVGTASTTAAASKKIHLQVRPLLLSPPPERSLTKSGSEATSATASISDDKTTEDDTDPDVIILGDNNERDDGDGKGDDEEGESDSSSDQLSSAQGMIAPQTRPTSLTLVSQKRRWSRSTQRQSITSIPLGLRPDELELMEAVEYCVSMLCDVPFHLEPSKLTMVQTITIYSRLSAPTS